MSYDVSFRRNVSNMEGELYLNESFNMTSNVGPMYRAAGLDVSALDKYTCKDVADTIIPRYEYMVAHPDEMRKLNPENGWGDYESALQFLKEILVTALTIPNVLWR